MNSRIWSSFLVVALAAGCSKEAKQLESIEKFNTFALRAAVDEYQRQLDANKNSIPQPDDVDHAAQMVMDACRNKPHAAEFKKVYDVVHDFQQIATDRKPTRAKVVAKFDEVKAALSAYEQKK